MSDTILEKLSSETCNSLTPRVKALRDAYFSAMPEICTERPEWVTRYYLKNKLFDRARISILDKAKMYRYLLENRKPVVHHHRAYKPQKNGEKPKPFDIMDDGLFAGSTTSKFKGVPLYPEFAIAPILWPELWTISTRKATRSRFPSPK